MIIKVKAANTLKGIPIKLNIVPLLISTVPIFKYGVDEFELSGLTARQGNYVDAPCVAESPAVLECELWKDQNLLDQQR